MKNCKLHFILLFALLFFSCKSNAFYGENRICYGLILDSEMQAVEGYKIFVNGKLQAVTSSQGNFSFELPRGDFEIFCTKRDWEAVRLKNFCPAKELLVLQTENISLLYKKMEKAVLYKNADELKNLLEKVSDENKSDELYLLFKSASEYFDGNFSESKNTFAKISFPKTCSQLASSFEWILKSEEKKNAK